MSHRILYKLSILLLICVIFSCKKQDKKSIVEIYTFKERQKIIEGIPYKEFAIKTKLDVSTLNDSDNLMYDTIRKEIIYAGQFDANCKELNSKPLVSDNEILVLDTIANKIKLSADAINKIAALSPSMKDGIQFVICVDKEPVLKGYFWNSFSSYGSTLNCIEYNTDKVSSSTYLKMYKGNGIDASKREKIKYNHYPKLISVLDKTDRIQK